MASRAKNILFAAATFCAFLALLEAAVRAPRGELAAFWNFRSMHIDLLRGNWPFAYHERLGYVPRPGVSSENSFWSARIAITEQGFRSNGGPPPTGRSAVMAFGDSFTFGDQVGDSETWPAHLERLLGSPVLNAGVSGYGLDQIALYVEELVPRARPSLAIVDLIADDIDRCAFSCRHAWKPYFDMEGGNAVLKNVPVPRARVPRQYVRNMLGYSRLADLLFTRLAYRWWLSRSSTVQVHADRMTLDAISVAMVERIALCCREQGCPLLLVIQGMGMGERRIDGQIDGTGSSREILRPLMTRAAELGAPILDLDAELDAVIAKDPQMRRRLVQGHMTAEGNLWVAGRIRDFLLQPGQQGGVGPHARPDASSDGAVFR